MGRTIQDIVVTDVEKRKIPTKHYVYVIYVTWSDGSTNVIYRRYSRFFDFQSRLIDMFPEESGALDPSKRIIPFLPGKKYFGRSHIREVAEKRMKPIAEYCKSIVGLPKQISQCKDLLSFFELDPEDINPPKGKKASVKGDTISNPKPLEVYVACTAYTKQEKGEVGLKVGMQVEVVEKTQTGWWFVNVEDEQGWVPSSCLQREDGVQEDSTIKFAPGEEEQYLCTEEFQGEGKDELTLERGAVVDVMEKNLEGWWLVRYNGKEGFVPATYLMQTDVLKIRKKPTQRESLGPEIVKSLHDISDLLRDKESTHATSEKNNNLNPGEDTEIYEAYEFQDDFDDDDDDEEKIYTIHEVSKILKADNRGSAETEKVYERIQNIKTRATRRSVRPPPRTSKKEKPMVPTKMERPPLVHSDSFNIEFITAAAFSDAVGDGISFDINQPVKVLERSENGWWYVEIKGREGWAPSSYIVEKGPAVAKNKTPSQARKSSYSPSSSKDNLTGSDDDTKSRRHSAITGLASAIKLKLQPMKGSKSPPAPPRKDFLDDHHSNIRKSVDREQFALSAASKAKSENDLLSIDKDEPMSRPASKPKSTGNRPSVPPPAPPMKSGVSDNTSFLAPAVPAVTKPFPLKPVANKPIPPVPPAKTSVPKPMTDDSTSERFSESSSGLANALKAKFEARDKDRPVSPKSPRSPTAPKPLTKPKFDDWPKPSDTKSEEKPKNVNVAGLASALQAKFEAKDSNNVKPEPLQKPKQDINHFKPEPLQKPKPNLPVKPAVEKKTEVPNIATKPRPPVPNKTQAISKPSDFKAPSIVAVTSNRVSDLASVLKAKLENKDKSHDVESEVSSNIQRPSSAVSAPVRPPAKPESKPGDRPQRPSVPPNFKKSQTNAQTNSGVPGKSLDPKKYTARPLPPKPGIGLTGDNKPSLPGKPKPIETGSTGFGGSLAEALQARLSHNADIDKKENAKTNIPPKSNPKTAIKPLIREPSPVRQDNYTEIDTTEDENGKVYRAVQAFDGGNEGEIGLAVGQEVVLLDQSGGWWYVSCDDQEGWAPADFLEKVRVPTVQVKINNSSSPVLARKKMNVYRTCSDFNGEQQGELTVPCGQDVEILEMEDDGWWFVKYNGEEGWVPSAYLMEVKS